jgi:hypothetical protein
MPRREDSRPMHGRSRPRMLRHVAAPARETRSATRHRITAALRGVRRVVGAMSLVVLCGLFTACISYTVGQGAETTPKSEQSMRSSVNLVPATIRDGFPGLGRLFGRRN